MTIPITIQAWILGEEGGVANVVGDHGGLTSTGGQTASWLEGVLGRKVTPEEIRSLTPAQAAANIATWLGQTGLAAIVPPDALDRFAVAIVDYAYQSGEGRAIPVLQRILGVAPTASHVGPATLAALAGQDLRDLADRVIGERLAFEGALVERDWAAAVATVKQTLVTHRVDADVVSTVLARLDEMQAKFSANWFARIGRILSEFK